jgi:type 1 glutamine amidotransferase
MPFELRIPRTGHAVTLGLPERLQFLDEPYWPLVGDPGRVRVLASGVVDGAGKPLVWTFERGAPDGRTARVFGSILGHYFWTLDDPLYRLMVLRAIAWAGGGEPELLKDAALIEANLE